MPRKGVHQENAHNAQRYRRRVKALEWTKEQLLEDYRALVGVCVFCSLSVLYCPRHVTWAIALFTVQRC